MMTGPYVWSAIPAESSDTLPGKVFLKFCSSQDKGGAFIIRPVFKKLLTGGLPLFQ